MKYSYPDSLITLAAAVTQACSLYVNKNNNPVAAITSKGSTLLKLNTNNQLRHNRVGIKFDNISAGKYFVLINKTQRHTVVSKVLGTGDKFMADSIVTTENELFEGLGRNEPSVLCQSAFL